MHLSGHLINRTPSHATEANCRPAGQWDGSDNLSATNAADRAFPAAVAEFERLNLWSA